MDNLKVISKIYFSLNKNEWDYFSVLFVEDIKISSDFKGGFYKLFAKSINLGQYSLKSST